MKRALFFVFFLAFISISFASESHSTEQTLCPVMEGNPVKKDIFVEYQGKKVYFCCDYCKAQFSQQPEKYLSKLPQFSTTTDHHHENNEHSHNDTQYNVASFIAPLGIATFIFLTTTLLSGFLMKKYRKTLFPWHWKLAVFTLLLAVCHVAIILLGHS